MVKKWLVLSLVLLLVSFGMGCSPIYQAQYSYTPPDSPQGQICVSQCEMNKINCEHLEEMRNENCEYRARLEYDHCRMYYDEDHCFEAWCSTDYSHCQEMFHACYKACGGRVDSFQACVAFCNQK